MTLEDFKQRLHSGFAISVGGYGLDPLTAALVMAALIGAATELGVKCIDSLWPHDVHEPGRDKQAALRKAFVRPAVRKAIAEHPEGGRVFVLQRLKVEGHVQDELLRQGRSLSTVEFLSLKADCRAMQAQG